MSKSNRSKTRKCHFEAQKSLRFSGQILPAKLSVDKQKK